MRKLLLALALLLLPISVCHASSTVTASARQYTRANNEYFSLVDNSSISTGNIDFSFAGWVYITSTANQLTLFPSKWQSGALEYVLIMNAGGALKFYCTDSSKPVTGATLSTATWYFIYVSHDSVNDLLSISVNDGAVTTAAYPSGVTDTTAGFTPGSNFGSAFMDGRMGPWGFWKKKLSAAEITSLYNSGSGKLYKDLTTDEKTSLISYWDGAETSGIAYDAHGTNHLTDNNTVTSAAGKVTYTAEDASQFTEANLEYLSIADASQTGLDVSSAFTLMGWIYLDGTAHNFLFGKWNTTGNNISYNIDRYSGQFRTIGSVNGSTQTINNFNVPSAGTPMWIHVAWSYLSGTGGVFYINGASAGATTNFGNVFNGTASFNIGRYDGGAVYLSGRASNVSVYSTNLDAAGVLAHYNRGFGLDYSDLTAGQKTNLVSWWPLTEPSGTRVDVHGSNNLTDNNTVTGAAGVVYDAPAVSTRGRVIMISNARLVEEPVYA